MPPLSWVEIHGAITHLPVAFLLAVPVFEIGAQVLRKPEWRVVSFWLLVSAVLLAVPALVTGWITGNDLNFTGAHAAPPTLFVWHRLAAFTTSGLAILLLLWRVKAHDQFPRNAHFAAMALAVIIAGAVGVTGFLGGRMVFGSSPRGAAYGPLEPRSAKTRIPQVEPQLIVAGQKLFGELPCQSCHQMEGKGGISGPDLTHEAQRHADISWHIAHLKDPAKLSPGSGMPPFDSLTAEELNSLTAYLATRK